MYISFDFSFTFTRWISTQIPEHNRRSLCQNRTSLHNRSTGMKFLTTNFVRCAIKGCDGTENSFPLKYENCKLQLEEQEFESDFIISMLERLDWGAIIKVAADLGNTSLPAQKPDNIDQNEVMLKDLHSLLLETQIIEGQMVCGNCGHIYYIKNSIASFLLPPHLAK